MEQAFETFVAKNLKYLRDRLNLSIQDLSEITDVDPITVFELEQAENHVLLIEKQSDLLTISDYFTIPLDTLILSDIEKEEIVTNEKLKSLLDERNDGVEINRKPFRKEIINYEHLDATENSTAKDVARSILKNIQTLNGAVKIYSKRRANGTTDKIDFFEPPTD